MYYSSLDELANEKIKLAYNTKEVVFLNYDDIYTRQIYNFVKVDKFLFRVSDKKVNNFDNKLKPDIRFDNYQLNLEKDNK
jgi:hypothetical protein